MGEPALPRRRKGPIRFDYICCVKETSRKQLRQRTNSRPTAAATLLDANFDVVTVCGVMDIFHMKEYFLSLSQGQRLMVPQVVTLSSSFS